MEQKMLIIGIVKNFKETNEIIRFNLRNSRRLIEKNKELENKINENDNKE